MKVIIDFTDYAYDARQLKAPRLFDTKAEATRWLTDGFCQTDGAERDHYADMLCQLNSGNSLLFYWGKPSCVTLKTRTKAVDALRDINAVIMDEELCAEAMVADVADILNRCGIDIWKE